MRIPLKKLLDWKAESDFFILNSNELFALLLNGFFYFNKGPDFTFLSTASTAYRYNSLSKAKFSK